MNAQNKRKLGKRLIVVPLFLLFGSFVLNMFFDAYFWGDGPSSSDIFGPSAKTCAVAISQHNTSEYKLYNPNYPGNKFLDQGFCVSREIKRVAFFLWPLIVGSLITGFVYYVLGSRGVAIGEEQGKPPTTPIS